MPAAAMSFGLTRTSGAPWERSFGRILRPIGVRTVSTRWPMTRNISGRKTNRAGAPLDAEGDMTGLLPGEPRRVRLRPPRRRSRRRSSRLRRRAPALLGAARGSGTRRNGAGRCPGRARARTRGTRGTWWLAIATTTLSASKQPVARLDHEPAAVSGQPLHSDAGSNRELELVPRRPRGSRPPRPWWRTRAPGPGKAIPGRAL